MLTRHITFTIQWHIWEPEAQFTRIMNSGGPYTKIKILAIKEFEDLKQLSEISKLLYIHWLFQLIFQPSHITPASSGIIRVVLAIATLFSTNDHARWQRQSMNTWILIAYYIYICMTKWWNHIQNCLIF